MPTSVLRGRALGGLCDGALRLAARSLPHNLVGSGVARLLIGGAVGNLTLRRGAGGSVRISRMKFPAVGGSMPNAATRRRSSSSR